MKGYGIVKSNKKIYKILTLVFAFIAICLAILYLLSCFKVNINIVTIFVGLTLLFSGLNQINMARNIESKGFINGDRILGILSIILGIVIIISTIIKI